MRRHLTGKKIVLLLSIGVILGVGVMVSFNHVMRVTTSNESCEACHVHPHATETWKKSIHYNNSTGTKVNCIDCHLPSKESPDYTSAKIKLGVKDLWGYITKDSIDFNWDEKGRLENAIHFVDNNSCIECHVNLYPSGISDQAITSHLYWEDNHEKLDIQCISCHLDAGHYNPNYSHGQLVDVPRPIVSDEDLFKEATIVETFENFTERIPGSVVEFNMIAIEGGTFKMGSPDSEKFRNSDESPLRNVTLDDFFIAEIETSWDEYYTFYIETMSEGRTPPDSVYARNTTYPMADAISGPTPPFGIPDQGWGAGKRPAITMTHYAAQTYCQWLSAKTGKNYRLPTEAEWEYVARAGSDEPYFFGGKPSSYSNQGFIRKFIDADTSKIASYFVYSANAMGKSELPEQSKANPWGVKNMQGNVMEYCLDKYDPNAYSLTSLDVANPLNSSGEEHVVRGGSFVSDASELRAAARSKTKHEDWLRTDPQNPKSIWWYSDTNRIGFRVVCEW
ncbi:MAG: SUMF1/EgtB/PvdO family nonheme iron enzyme [Rikenellaceae bacterium]